jgi:hypothetical protein
MMVSSSTSRPELTELEIRDEIMKQVLETGRAVIELNNGLVLTVDYTVPQDE